MVREVLFYVPSTIVIQGSKLPTKSLKIPKTKKLPNFDGTVLKIHGSCEHFV